MLPFRRRIVASAIGEALNLDGPNSHVYLRKLIKSSLTIDLTLENLQDSFVTTFGQAKPAGRQRVLNLDSGLVAWYMLLHTILLEELVETIGQPDRADADLSLEEFLRTKSDYLAELFDAFLSSAWALEEQKAWQPLEAKYADIKYLADNKSSLFMGVIAQRTEGGKYKQLSRLTDSQVVNARLRPQSGSDSRDLTFFEAVILPNIKNSRRETLLTDEYSRRDMEQLAEAIQRDLHFNAAGNLSETEYLKQLSNVVKSRFSEFR